MTIQRDGAVGVGVADPDETLEVAGRIHVSSEVAAPSAPAAGDGGIMYVKADGKLYWISDDLSETDLTQGAGGSVDAANGVADRLATFTDSNSLNGEANLTFNGSTLAITGSILPGTNSTYDLGSAAKRWANVYTGDLHLKNERGDWTIVEEEDYLTVINNKKNKRYKFVLEEID